MAIFENAHTAYTWTLDLEAKACKLLGEEADAFRWQRILSLFDTLGKHDILDMSKLKDTRPAETEKIDTNYGPAWKRSRRSAEIPIELRDGDDQIHEGYLVYTSVGYYGRRRPNSRITGWRVSALDSNETIELHAPKGVLSPVYVGNYAMNGAIGILKRKPYMALEQLPTERVTIERLVFEEGLQKVIDAGLANGLPQEDFRF